MRYARNPRVLWRSTSRGPVLLAPDRAEPELLGGRAAVVWEVLDEPLTTAEIAEAARAVIAEADDADGAIDELIRLGLVEAQP